MFNTLIAAVNAAHEASFLAHAEITQSYDSSEVSEIHAEFDNGVATDVSVLCYSEMCGFYFGFAGK